MIYQGGDYFVVPNLLIIRDKLKHGCVNPYMYVKLCLFKDLEVNVDGVGLVSKLVEVHDGLRTALFMKGGVLYQSVIDVLSVPVLKYESEIEDGGFHDFLMSAYAIIDPFNGKPLVAVQRIGRTSTMYLLMTHLGYDMYSKAVILKTVREYVEGENPIRRGVGYRDWVLAHYDYLQRCEAKSELAFWLKQPSDGALLMRAFLKPDSNVLYSKKWGRRVVLTVSGAFVFEVIMALCERCSCSMTEVLLCALAVSYRNISGNCVFSSKLLIAGRCPLYGKRFNNTVGWLSGYYFWRTKIMSDDLLDVLNNMRRMHSEFPNMGATCNWMGFMLNCDSGDLDERDAGLTINVTIKRRAGNLKTHKLGKGEYYQVTLEDTPSRFMDNNLWIRNDNSGEVKMVADFKCPQSATTAWLNELVRVLVRWGSD